MLINLSATSVLRMNEWMKRTVAALAAVDVPAMREDAVHVAIWKTNKVRYHFEIRWYHHLITPIVDL
jgi:hypothetical protein